ncbi:hypothetical protein R3F64_17050 [Halomonas sp. 5021]|jgi:hypothetical protein|uniref:hypothetical protein n=1 Tax=Halomonas sp. 5021 TaxID=3082156 RepID=UPI002FC763CB
MTMFYYLRVFFVSYEFAFLLLCWVVYAFLQENLSKYFPFPSLNQDALKWAMLIPGGVAGWTLKEGVGVIFPSEKNEKVLHEWPDYWRLKVHFDVGVLNSILFVIPCFIVWLLGALNTLVGAWVFIGFAGALSINAFSFYAAKIAIKSALIRLNDGKT